MAKATVTVKGAKELQKKLEQVAKDISGAPLINATRDATLLVQRGAKQLAPVDTGRLRASIIPEIVKQVKSIQGIVGSNLSYAPYMEFGTGTVVGRAPHRPPSDALNVWARRHGIPSGYLVARAIGRRGGLEGYKYLTGSLRMNTPKIERIFACAVRRVVAK